MYTGVLVVRLGALCKLGKHFSTELHPALWRYILVLCTLFGKILGV